jgi:hypothetical protein
MAVLRTSFDTIKRISKKYTWINCMG